MLSPDPGQRKDQKLRGINQIVRSKEVSKVKIGRIEVNRK